MRGGLGGFKATALINGDIHQSCPRLEFAELRAADQLGRCGTGYQYRPDDHIRFAGQFDRVADRSIGRFEHAAKNIVKITQAGKRPVKHCHIGTHAGGNSRGVCPDNAAPDDRDPRRANPGHATHQHTAAAIGLLQGPGTHLRCQPACDLGHRCKQRQPTGAVGNGLICNAGGT